MWAVLVYCNLKWKSNVSECWVNLSLSLVGGNDPSLRDLTNKPTNITVASHKLCTYALNFDSLNCVKRKIWDKLESIFQTIELMVFFYVETEFEVDKLNRDFQTADKRKQFPAI